MSIKSDEDKIIKQALSILKSRINQGDCLSSPNEVREFLQLKIAESERELFLVIFLDQQNKLLKCEEMFKGSLTQSNVYPREIVKAALKQNAAGVIVAHNHPADTAEPSFCDQHLTTAIKKALALVEIRLLDHIIVTRGCTVSLSERGLL